MSILGAEHSLVGKTSSFVPQEGSRARTVAALHACCSMLLHFCLSLQCSTDLGAGGEAASWMSCISNRDGWSPYFSAQLPWMARVPTGWSPAPLLSQELLFLKQAGEDCLPVLGPWAYMPQSPNPSCPMAPQRYTEASIWGSWQPASFCCSH